VQLRDNNIGELALLAPAFAFKLPPYFVNNARAVASLEGLALSAKPDFSVLQALPCASIRATPARTSGT